MRINSFIFIIVFLITFISKLHSQGYPLSNKAYASVLTCGSGNELYSIFGHTALRIKDSIQRIDVVYNYGMFDFSTPNFNLKFIKGDLQYFMASSSFDYFITSYIREDRDVFEQKLPLKPEEVQLLFSNLNRDLLSESRYYTYKFIDKNCTTMVAEKISPFFKNKTLEKVSNKDISYREIINSYLDNFYFEKLGINILFGYKTDEDAAQLFLPRELLESLSVKQTNENLLVKEVKILNKKQNPDTVIKFKLNSFYTLITILILLVISNTRLVYSIYLTLFGLLGIFLLILPLFSQHKEIVFNYNTLLFNPLYLILLFLDKKKTYFKKLLYTCVFLVVVHFVFILNKSQLLVFLPIISSTLFILWRYYIKTYKNLLTSVK